MDDAGFARRSSHRRQAHLLAISPEATAYAAEAYAPATIAAYQADCAHFERWCAAESRITLPADLDAIACYIVAHGETLGRATLGRRLARAKRRSWRRRATAIGAGRRVFV